MCIEIFVNDELKEESLPFIELTKSRNGQTGTATFVFFQPTFLTKKENILFPIHTISLVSTKRKIKSKEIEILFWKGQPSFLKVIFLFRNSKEWFEFLVILNSFSKEKGFVFDSNSYKN